MHSKIEREGKCLLSNQCNVQAAAGSGVEQGKQGNEIEEELNGIEVNKY